MLSNSHFTFFQTQVAKKFIEQFNQYLIDQRGFDLSSNANGKDIRSLFFRFFSTKEFKVLYEGIAKELAKKFDISEDDLLIQANPTPRVFRPGDHGTNWHNDYWYGHGKYSRTVWVPIKGVVPGASFSVIKDLEDNKEMVSFYEQNTELLSQSFDLKGRETYEVIPPENSVAVFSSELLHSSILNTAPTERFSFDFRFTVRDDVTSTKDLSSYLALKDGKLVSQKRGQQDSFLKYIRGGHRINTAAQHILIEDMSRNADVEIISQEAEIERFGQPMFKFHLKEIYAGSSQFKGIAVASKALLDEEILSLLKERPIPIYFALENEWI